MPLLSPHAQVMTDPATDPAAVLPVASATHSVDGGSGVAELEQLEHLRQGSYSCPPVIGVKVLSLQPESP